jgi:VanZ family protein
MTASIPTVRGEASPIARAALLAYLLLIVYASWFPFSGWHASGLAPLAFAEHVKMPRYWTGFDVAINVVGYLPLGLLIVYSLHPHIKGWLAIALTIVCGVLISGTMEAVQSYLPSRVPSNLDLFTNVTGCCIGAVLGALSARRVLDRSHIYRLRQRWFARHASQGLVLLALWPLAQIYPQGYLFGQGQLLPIVSEWLSLLLGGNIDLATWLRLDTELTVQQYWLSEIIITACGMTGAGLTLLCVLRRTAPKGMLVGALLAGAVLVKTLATALLFTPQNAFVWITPGAQGGFLIGLLMLGGLAFAPHSAQRRLAALTLLLSLLIVNATPPNPYFTATLQSWVQGKFLNFNGAAQILSIFWPFFALWFIWLPSHKLNRTAGAET